MAVIIAFYLFRKQFDKKEIPTTFLWNQVIEEWQASKWWKKLQQNLLFYLQLLFILLLVIALARPYITTEKLTGETGAVVLDVSATMTAGVEESRFEGAREKILDLIDHLGDDQSLTLVTAGSVPELIFANETNKSKMKKKVEALSVTYEEENITEAISLASSYITNKKGSLYIYSDDVTKEEIEDVTQQVNVQNIGGNVTNLSLLTFGVKNNQATATVKNETTKSTSIRVALYSESNERIHVLKQDVKSGESYTFQFDNLPEESYYKAQIENKDDYEIDNTLYSFSELNEAPEVYFVGDVSPFIKRAVSLLGYEPITLSLEDGTFSYPKEENAVYVMSRIGKEQWPESGNLLVFSPEVEETNGYQVEKKVELEKTLKGSQSPFLQYVKMENVYLKAAYPTADTSLEPIVKSGDIPVLLYGTLEGQHVMLSAFDMNDSDWPLHPGFPIFIQNTIQQFAKTQSMIGVYNPGEEVELPFSTRTTGGTLEDSDGSKVTDLDIDEWKIKAPYSPGIYTVTEERTEGDRESQFVVAIPSNERSPQYNDSFSLGQKMQGTTKSGKTEWWPIFVAAGLLILLIEWEVYRRGIAYR